MRLFNTIATLARRFRGDRMGNFGLMMAVVAPTLMLAGGYGLNVAQMVNARSKLLNALDSAVTSTARDLTTGTIQERDARAAVEAFLFTNSEGGFTGAGDVTLGSLVIDKADNTLSATASVVIDVVFPVFGINNRQTITTESAAIYSNKKIEIAMMLDVTGSMAKSHRDDKLGDMKTAASNVVDLLLKGQDERNPRVRISIVPYANSVNVGSSIARQAVFAERKESDRRQAPANTDPKAVAAGSSRPDNCATERKGRYQYTNHGPETSMVNRDYFLDRYAGGVGGYGSSRTCPEAQIVPLTADADQLLDAIDDFKAEGGTAGHIGIQWSWYMLSQSWKNVLPAASMPARVDPSKVAKYAILMTDGEFNLSYFDIDHAGQAYDDNGKPETREAASQLCGKMREAGIEVFTIGFKLQDRKAKETMSNCASPDTGPVRHYYDTADGEELNAAFMEIAATIERLALTR